LQASKLTICRHLYTSFELIAGIKINNLQRNYFLAISINLADKNEDNITCSQLSTPVLEKAKATEGHDFVFQSRRYGTNTFRALNLIVVH
jgi:uncharacterized Fe-S center protein